MFCAATTSTSMRIPCGYRFCPTDEELLLVYLKRKLHNLPLPCDVIKEVELYEFDPNELLAQFGSMREEKCYFFTSTYRKYPKGNQTRRSTNNGFWKAGAAIEIKDERNNLIGTKRSLAFHFRKHPHGNKTNWIMYEYKLYEDQSVNHVQISTDPMKLEEWVLCSIYENSSATERESRKRKAIVLSEELDTSSKEREIVLQQGPLSGNQDNEQSMVPLFDNLPAEPRPNAFDVGFDTGPISEAAWKSFMDTLNAI
ncbi:NAC transcription factor 32-like protein [Cinnamomum micranthum f. kanehirae]|uniref:NAC transcription factor 32-like protein n=1 Tax=Cinnamomum micranthum f. kanehirae TaxID=337451 RepID=A0A3S3MD58_9MAGN|nr:NAC transcription factor 32-like protein [Cinnamomum micranthum f. kanehirae]